ncbi:hypothetical protein [Roseovarius sp. MBR-6]
MLYQLSYWGSRAHLPAHGREGKRPVERIPKFTDNAPWKKMR